MKQLHWSFTYPFNGARIEACALDHLLMSHRKAIDEEHQWHKSKNFRYHGVQGEVVTICGGPSHRIQQTSREYQCRRFEKPMKVGRLTGIEIQSARHDNYPPALAETNFK